MMVVLAGTLIVHASRSDLGIREFIIWLVFYYLTTLAVETGMILKGRAQPR